MCSACLKDTAERKDRSSAAGDTSGGGKESWPVLVQDAAEGKRSFKCCGDAANIKNHGDYADPKMGSLDMKVFGTRD